MRTWILRLFAAGLLGAAVPALAAPCAGFTDVDTSSGFCANVEWLKNRAITLGCTSATLYCPADPVSRLQMAAFLNRLGTALTPVIRYLDDAGSSLDLGSQQFVCQTPALAIDGYPRSVHLRAALSGLLQTAAIVVMSVMESTDGGEWIEISTAAQGHGANGWLNLSTGRADYRPALGTSVSYAIYVRRSGSLTGDFFDWNCQLEAVFHSRTGTSSPF